MQEPVETLALPAPPRRLKQRRLTKELKATPVDPNRAIRLDRNTANCLRDYAHRHKWVLVAQTQEDGTMLIWRIE